MSFALNQRMLGIHFNFLFLLFHVNADCRLKEAEERRKAQEAKRLLEEEEANKRNPVEAIPQYSKVFKMLCYTEDEKHDPPITLMLSRIRTIACENR